MSLSVGVSCAEEWVSAWKKAKHGTDPPRTAVRSTPASTKVLVWWPEALPGGQGTSAAGSAASLAIAHIESLATDPQTPPWAMAVTTLPTAGTVAPRGCR